MKKKSSSSSPGRTISTNPAWFQEQLKKQDISQRQLAAMLDIAPSGLTRAFHGKRKLKLNEAADISRLLAVPIDEVMAAAGMRIPGLSATASKDMMELKGWVDGESVVHWGPPKGPKTVPKPNFGGRGLGVVRFQTIGSGLEGMDGVLAYYNESSTAMIPDCVGRPCVIHVAGIGQAKSGEGGSRGQGHGSSTGGSGLAAGQGQAASGWRLGVLKRSYSAGTYNIVSTSGVPILESVGVDRAWPISWLKY